MSMRRVEGSNLLGLAPTSFQDSRITVLPTLLLKTHFGPPQLSIRLSSTIRTRLMLRLLEGIVISKLSFSARWRIRIVKKCQCGGGGIRTHASLAAQEFSKLSQWTGLCDSSNVCIISIEDDPCELIPAPDNDCFSFANINRGFILTDFIADTQGLTAANEDAG